MTSFNIRSLSRKVTFIDSCHRVFSRLLWHQRCQSSQKHTEKILFSKRWSYNLHERIISIPFLRKKNKIFGEQHFCTYAPFNTSLVTCDLSNRMIDDILSNDEQFILSSFSLKFTILTFLSKALKIHMLE